ncbi:hypothetical protein BH10ACT3_BH10ACT3_10450 [soil metagenome]
MVDLCRASLGWQPNDPNEAFFAWKHDQNSFGASPAWVAETTDGELAGVRMFLRWRFRSPGGETLSAVRAVDTATHPEWQGKGVFTRLTLGALPDLGADGIDCVFNTPNDKSRPGYLKMGWEQVGRLPVSLRVRGLRSLPRVAGARAAAEKWSRSTDIGLSAVTYFDDDDAVASLLARSADEHGIRTDRDAAYLRWRYSFEQLRYRVIPLGDRYDDGAIVFRLRARGSAVEAAVVEVLVPRGGSARSAVGWMLRATGADYALRTGTSAPQSGFVPVPRLGPILTWRSVASPYVPNLPELDLALGDVELF